jgi:hypothetical protein
MDPIDLTALYIRTVARFVPYAIVIYLAICVANVMTGGN